MKSNTNQTNASSDLKGTRILVVDDLPENVDVAFRMLDSVGIQVMAALNGESALEAIQRKRPDLVLLDVRMPGMDGFETCRRLRAIDGFEELPVIFLTSQGDEASVVEGFDVGATDYVTKPFRKEALLSRIHAHLQPARWPHRLSETLKL
jgi:DNA-binding response OmpR family regulator